MKFRQQGLWAPLSGPMTVREGIGPVDPSDGDVYQTADGDQYEYEGGVWTPKAELFIGYNASPRFAVIGLDGEVEAGWPSFGGLVYAIASSPDGSKIAVGYAADPWYSVIDFATKTIEAGWPTIPGAVRGLSWSADGSRLAVGHALSPYLTVIDVATKTAETGWQIPAGSIVYRLAWSPDGNWLAVPGNNYPRGVVYDAATKQIVATTEGATAYSARWSPDGTMLAFGRSSAAGIEIYETGTWTRLQSHPNLGDVQMVAWNLDGTRVVGADETVERYTVIDVAGEAIETGWPAMGDVGDGLGATWSPAGSRLLIAGTFAAPNVKAIDPSTKEVDPALEFSGTQVWTLCYRRNPGISR